MSLIITKWLVHYPKQVVRIFLTRMAVYVSQYPKLRSKLILHINRYPHIKSKLKSFVINNNINARSYNESVKKKKHILYKNDEDSYPIDTIEHRECITQAEMPRGVNYEKKSPLEKWFY